VFDAKAASGERVVGRRMYPGPSDVCVERVTPDGILKKPQDADAKAASGERVVGSLGTDRGGVSSSRVTRKVRNEVRVRGDGVDAKAASGERVVEAEARK
jgi:hypothetical protein